MAWPAWASAGCTRGHVSFQRPCPVWPSTVILNMCIRQAASGCSTSGSSHVSFQLPGGKIPGALSTGTSLLGRGT
eukprot:6434385-Pyramimonas_sp.AAC.1